MGFRVGDENRLPQQCIPHRFLSSERAKRHVNAPRLQSESKNVDFWLWNFQHLAVLIKHC
jgi:hypothetical protein